MIWARKNTEKNLCVFATVVDFRLPMKQFHEGKKTTQFKPSRPQTAAVFVDCSMYIFYTVAIFLCDFGNVLKPTRFPPQIRNP